METATRQTTTGLTADRGPVAIRAEQARVIAELKESRRQYAAELAKAAKYVEALLPPKITSGAVQTDWVFIPSIQLGGDSFGYHWIDDEHFVMYLLDVTGHGIGAALHSVSVVNVLRSQTLNFVDPRDPSSVLATLNSTFQMKDFNDMYFTIWYGVYNRKTRVLRYASGGHPPALLRTGSRDNYSIDLHRSGGILIGGVRDAEFPSVSVTIPEDSVLYLFSDGVYEVPKDDGMMDFDEFVGLLCAQTFAGEDSPSEIAARIAEIQTCEACLDDFALVRISFP